MTAEQEIEFQNSNHCHICELPYQLQDIRVRDHNHLQPNNNYRGSAHEECNLQYKDDRIVPIVFHNLSGYDAHFIILDIASK